MTKELTPLEALNSLVGMAVVQQRAYTLKPIIEKALKRLENYEQNEDFSKDVLNYAFLNEKDIIKKLKALEIIKEKRVDVSWLMKCFGFIENATNEEECDYYNNNYEAYRNSKPLTQEEYDLLKEVLL